MRLALKRSLAIRPGPSTMRLAMARSLAIPQVTETRRWGKARCLPTPLGPEHSDRRKRAPEQQHWSSATLRLVRMPVVKAQGGQNNTAVGSTRSWLTLATTIRPSVPMRSILTSPTVNTAVGFAAAEREHYRWHAGRKWKQVRSVRTRRRALLRCLATPLAAPTPPIGFEALASIQTNDWSTAVGFKALNISMAGNKRRASATKHLRTTPPVGPSTRRSVLLHFIIIQAAVENVALG